MADSYVLFVEKQLTSHIESLITASGVFDLTGKVHRGRDRFGQSHSDKPPLVSLLQAADIDESFFPVGQSNNQRSDQKTYLIQGWVNKGGLDAVTDPAHELLAEVKKTLSVINISSSQYYGMKDRHPDGRYLVSNIAISSGLVRPPEQETSFKYAFFWLPVKLGLLEDVNNPYALP